MQGELSPQGNSELRQAGLAACALLLIDSATQYGFIEGGPVINAERCEAVAMEADAAGFTYSHEETTETALTMIAWNNASPSERAAALGEGSQHG